MSERKTNPTSTSISQPKVDRITVRGGDLCSEIVGHESFPAYFLRLLGVERTPALVTLVDATLVAMAEHGLVPSVQTARMTYAASPEALHGAVAAGLLGCGSVILGASEDAGRFLSGLLQKVDEGAGTLEEIALAAVTDIRADRRSLPGFGHPLHRPEDPRAWRLLEIAEDLGSSGRHIAALMAVRDAIPQVYGRPLPLNISGAIPSVLLDAGFPLGALKGIPLIARTASLVAHLLEEQAAPIGFALSNAAEAAISYTVAPSTKDLASEETAT